MKRGFLDKVEDNAVVRIWDETMQREKGDSLTERHVSEFCFTIRKVDLVPTVEEYTTLLRCPKIQVNKAYSRAASVLTLRNLVLVHPDVKKRVDVFALGIYGLVIFPKALGHIDEVVFDLFDRLSKGVTLVPALAETFRSLNAYRRAGEGRFIGCAQLLLTWFHSHF
ncbi:hypothetical protein Goshw_012460 [Gossypium schwendimanii]|uniref:DUF7745 domain-containing protein n=1 Tax=Gossypium schwendimanii TaxID=34291 RepID=A0A7J9NA23_GOSSC|nr:hypothetical protein [Gossypium schwendimanii]